MSFDQISPRSLEYLANVKVDSEDFQELTTQFITKMESFNLHVPEFGDEFEWLNTSTKLSFKEHLSGKLCVLDFFTYCCINCMHVLPDLHALEGKFSIKDGVAVIGVHSAKFQNEKLLANILSAVLRYDINHPIVNDANALFWNQMSVRCWPTFVVISPDGRPLIYFVGEGHCDILLKFVGVALDFYKQKGLIRDHDLPIKLAKDSLKKNTLKFPGKLTISPSGDEIAISNTSHHNVVIVTAKTGVVSQVIGNGKPGLMDGEFTSAQFNAPQGLIWKEHFIFVADTENHSIRKINLKEKKVTTITGTGRQGVDKDGGKDGTNQEISSPWDVMIGLSPGSEASSSEENCLYIAMAGTHQIWCYFIEDGTWLKKGSQVQNTCIRFAGSGNEENRNNSYPHKASFAQPSGLTMATVKAQCLIYVADSESSCVRTLDVKTGTVKACVGGERDPTNLFAFGDADGTKIEAKLQHPLAVVYNKKDGLVYVADSYNHKVKVIDPVSMTCTTLAGTGHPGYKDGEFSVCEFNEPGGLAVDQSGDLMFAADTNNHQIRMLDLKNKIVSTLSVIGHDIVDGSTINSRLTDDGEKDVFRPLVTRKQAKEVEPRDKNLKNGIQLSICLNLGSLKFTDDVDSNWQITSTDLNSAELLFHARGKVNKDESVIRVQIPPALNSITVKVETVLYVCASDNLCLMKSAILQQIVNHDDNSDATLITITENVETL